MNPEWEASDFLNLQKKWILDTKLPQDETSHNDGITNLEKFAFGLDANKAISYDANANFKHSTDENGKVFLKLKIEEKQ